MKSKYQMGWIGIRASKIGRSAKLLKRAGYFQIGRADLNNRNSFDWVCPVKDLAKFNSTDWRALADAGLVGIAIWICDAQWGKNSGVTDFQWQNRAIVEKEFNAQWPSGRRN